MKMLNEDEKFEFQLLPDKPLTADQIQNIKFGFPLVSSTLVKIITKAEPPFTIGLFGRWGTGKSTIINLVENDLKKLKIPTVQFDVWKYEKDSLRRQFLINIDEKLELGLNYKKALNQSLTTPRELRFTDTVKRLLKQWFFIGFISIFVIFLVLATAKFANLGNFLIASGWINRQILDALYDFSLLSLILSFLIGSTQVVYGTVQEDKTDSADGFEDKFYNEVLPKVNSKKLLIAIDNLDRTSHQNAVQLLTDIKTFLDKNGEQQNKVIFLIACDEKAILKHLKESKFDSPSEFLRKFFNASMNIPAYLGEELDDYTRGLIKETKIGNLIENDDLEWLITYAFRDNPREIKQFINTLVANYLLAKEAEDTNQIVTKGLITNNVVSLAKLLIIKQKYTYLFTRMETKVLREALSWEEIQADSFVASALPHDLENRETVIYEIRDFLRNTSYIKLDSLAILLRMRQSDQEQKVPQVEQLILYLEEKKHEEATKILTSYTDMELQNLDDILKNYIRKAFIKTNNTGNTPTRAFSLSSTYVKVADKKLSKTKWFIKEFVLNFPTSSTLLNILADYSPSFVFTTLVPACDSKEQHNITSSYISLFKISKDDNKTAIPMEYVRELLTVIVNQPALFDSHTLEINRFLESNVFDFEMLDIFTVASNPHKWITAKTTLNYITSLNHANVTEDIDIGKNRLDFLLKLDIGKHHEQALNKYLEIMQTESSQTRPEIRTVIANCFFNLLKQKINVASLQAIPNQETEKAISAILTTWYQQETTNEGKSILIKPIQHLAENDNNPHKNELVARTTDYIQHRMDNKLASSTENDLLDKYISQYQSAFVQACVRDESLIGFLDKNEYLGITEQLFKHYISTSAFDKGLALLNKLEKKVSKSTFIGSEIITILGNMHPVEQENYLAFMAKVNCFGADTIKDGFFNFLKGIVDTRPTIVETYKSAKFLKREQRVELQNMLKPKEDTNSQPEV